jgi:hypothetical protein
MSAARVGVVVIVNLLLATWPTASFARHPPRHYHHMSAPHFSIPVLRSPIVSDPTTSSLVDPRCAQLTSDQRSETPGCRTPSK